MRRLTAAEIDPVAGGPIPWVAIGAIAAVLGVAIMVGLYVYEEYYGEPDPTVEWDYEIQVSNDIVLRGKNGAGTVTVTDYSKMKTWEISASGGN